MNAMSPRKEHSARFYRMLLTVATLCWGGNFVIGKFAVSTLDAVWVVAIRFLGAGVLLSLIFFKRIRANINPALVRAGCFMGFFTFLGFCSQFVGLAATTPAKNAFLSTCYCVTVPFIWWLVAKRRPTKNNLFAAFVCVCGMGLITLQGSLTIGRGDAISILSAVLYGAEIVVIARHVGKHDIITVSAVQMVACGAYSVLLGLATQTPFDFGALQNPVFIGQMVYITLLGSLFGSTVQNHAQAHIPPAQVSIICALESVFGTIFSVIFLGEALTLQLVVGFALVFIAILISELGDKVIIGHAAPAAKTSNDKRPSPTPQPAPAASATAAMQQSDCQTQSQ